MNESCPVGLALAVCDRVELDDVGRRNILGVINEYRIEGFPAILPRVSVYVALTDTREGDQCRVELVDGSTEEVLSTLAEITLPSSSESSGTGIIEFDLALEPFPYEFSHVGLYVVRVWGNQHVVLQRGIQLFLNQTSPAAR